MPTGEGTFLCWRKWTRLPIDTMSLPSHAGTASDRAWQMNKLNGWSRKQWIEIEMIDDIIADESEASGNGGGT